MDGIYCEEKCQVFRPDGYDDCGACICGADNAYDCQPESGTPCGYIGEIGSSDVCQCYLDYEKVPICAQPPVFTDDCPAFCGNSTDCGEGEMCADLQDDVCFDQTAGCDPGEFPANQQCVKECLNVDLDMEQTD